MNLLERFWTEPLPVRLFLLALASSKRVVNFMTFQLRCAIHRIGAPSPSLSC